MPATQTSFCRSEIQTKKIAFLHYIQMQSPSGSLTGSPYGITPVFTKVTSTHWAAQLALQLQLLALELKLSCSTRREAGTLVHLHSRTANMLHLQCHQTSILIGKWSRLLTWIPSHLFHTKKAEVETSRCNLPHYVVFTGIDIYFPAFLFSFKCTHQPFNKHWSAGKKENPSRHPLQTHLELNQLLYVKKT